MDISLLTDLGLPMWVLIVAVFLLLLHNFGMLEPLKRAISRFSEDQQAARQFSRDRIADREEAAQALTAKLTDKLLNVVDNQQHVLADIRGEIFKARSHLEIITREWSRIAETQDDIDQYLWDVKQELAALYLVVEQLARLMDRSMHNESKTDDKSDKDTT